MHDHKGWLKKFFAKSIPVYQELPANVKEDLDLLVDGYRNFLVGQLKKCESPIEQLLFINLYEEIKAFSSELSIFGPDSNASLTPQQEVELDGKVYRPDFTITVIKGDRRRLYAVECDGHDFHEKTKKQAAKDRSRERKLIAAGYTVIRFTGSEIWKDPLECAKQVKEIIDNDAGVTMAWNHHYDEMLKEQ